MREEAEKKSRSIWWQASLAAFVLVVLGVIAVVRVLPPAEVRTVTPVANAAPIERKTGTAGLLYSAPLIVDGDTRVYASARQVRADSPVAARTERTPAWTFRRWPQSVLGVVEAGGVVVSRWTDGELVGIRASDGEIVWRAPGPESAPDAAPATPRRTGEELVWTPADLYTATDSGGDELIVVRGAVAVRVFEAATGRERAPIGATCGPASFTTASGGFACRTATGLTVYDLAGGAAREWVAAGEVTADSCRLGASECALVRDGGKAYRFAADGVLAAPAADAPGAKVLGEVVYITDGARTATARNLATGAEIWTWPGRTWDEELRVLAVQPGRVHLLNAADRLITLDAATGTQLSLFAFGVPTSKNEPTRERHWTPGTAYATDGLVVTVRRKLDAPDTAEDKDYYFAGEGVAVAVS
ncbi:outer membrane protein assembly factor BamB [Catenuloplanes nepalensis]|uniref:Outer membrane protein assembly factor BamB n=1 Tax=Catenuloplanes nepalensis TaxID=587533 RepID=A0ABT9N445_9ACTN|nr:PQQ-binding-like beta-propeller repeat protein [Catenuloplanes nepalensis]MDP9798196.1 outer membrane protein assembly factor BamB [Catenuloplanes nepalensis]